MRQRSMVTAGWLSLALATTALGTSPVAVGQDALNPADNFLYLPFREPEGADWLTLMTSAFDHHYPDYTCSQGPGTDACRERGMEITLWDGEEAYPVGARDDTPDTFSCHAPGGTPVLGAEYCGYVSGYEGVTGKSVAYYDGHDGYDWALPAATPIVAAAAGTVTSVGYEGCYGWTVEIDHGNDYSTRYSHLRPNEQNPELGTVVDVGAQIGVQGNSTSSASCSSTGEHLHFRVYHENGEGWELTDPFGWCETCTGAPPDPLEAYNGETSRNLWFGTTPRSVGDQPSRDNMGMVWDVFNSEFLGGPGTVLSVTATTPKVVWVKKGTAKDASHVPYGEPVTLVTRFHGDVDVAEVRFTAYYPDWPNAKNAAKVSGFDPKETWRTLKVCRPNTKGCSWDGDRQAATVSYTWDPTVGEKKRSIQGVPKADPAISLASTKCVPVTLGIDAMDASGTITSAPGGKIAQRCDAKASGLARTVFLDPLAPPAAPGNVVAQTLWTRNPAGDSFRTKVRVSWDDVAGATEYDVFRVDHYSQWRFSRQGDLRCWLTGTKEPVLVGTTRSDQTRFEYAYGYGRGDPSVPEVYDSHYVVIASNRAGDSDPGVSRLPKPYPGVEDCSGKTCKAVPRCG